MHFFLFVLMIEGVSLTQFGLSWKPISGMGLERLMRHVIFGSTNTLDLINL